MIRRAALMLALLALAPGCACPRACPCEGPSLPCLPPAEEPRPAPSEDVTALVDPFIGTGGHGHTFPGASVPFGLVQLSPDTRLSGWDGCSGYHHADEAVYGFSHTHLSGTGCSDYGDVLLVPTVGEVLYHDGADDKPGYRSAFSHEREKAEPGYYSVFLDGPKVTAELTATARAGVHRYTFPETAEANVVVDLTKRDDVLDSSLEVVGGDTLRGHRRSRAWAADQPVYFFARFSRPFDSFGIAVDGKPVAGTRAEGKDVRAHVRFRTARGERIEVRVGISGVDVEGARGNLDAEVGARDFEAVRTAAKEAWRAELSKATVRGGSLAQRRTFTTALYHCFLAPNVFSDVDGRYRGMDGKVHRAEGYEHHTVFSLWDTFRAEHPLLTILEPKRSGDLVRTLVADWKDGGTLPVWELWGSETGCMIGYHAVPVIADAYAKGIRGFRPDAALAAMKKSAGEDRLGLRGYREHGYVPAEDEGESVSRTLEYAYDDWCIAETARRLGRPDDTRAYLQRAQAFLNVYDASTGFMRAKRNGAFVTPFDPAEVNSNYTEANAWQYSLFVPQDTEALVRLHGGRKALAEFLDRLFEAPARTTGREQADISGQIGQYAHGNEPSHHIAYLYCHAGEPWKAQQRVRQILDTLYSDRPDGLCGNEDCGQMSAWYVFSALGFYPVTPATNEYVIGAPLFPEATIDVGGGRTFSVSARGVAPGNPYVQAAWLDGEPLARPVLSHERLVAGGRLVFEMGPQPSRWGSAEEALPRTAITEHRIVPVPLVTKAERMFHGSTEVSLAGVEGAALRLSLDGGKTFEPYAGPARIEKTTVFLAYAVRDGEESSRVTGRCLRLPHDWTLRLGTQYARQYPANGDSALIDGLHGRPDWWTGDWQGYGGVDVDATIDLQKATEVRTVRGTFLQDVKSWIWFPKEVVVTVSDDGKDWRPFGTATHDVGEREEGRLIHVFELKGRATARFVRLLAKTRGSCPDWHPGVGHPSWLFADEIEVGAGD